MKHKPLSLLLLFANFVLSCTTNVNEKKQPDTSRQVALSNRLIGKPVVPVNQILKDFSSFWTYFNQGAQLFHDYPTFAENGRSIKKQAFLDSISTGKHLPVVIYGKDKQLQFKLAKIPPGTDQNVGLTLRGYASREIKHYQMEGKPFPHFDVTTLTGKSYSSANTKGKIVLFKCWFIGCVQCVAEMPELNALIKRYQGRADILFISLAIDGEKELQKFLSKTKFDYETVANQQKYMENDLHVGLYPTHFIINKKGEMVKALTDVRDLYPFLEKELAQ